MCHCLYDLNFSRYDLPDRRVSDQSLVSYTDTHAQTRDDSIHRASVASRGKNQGQTSIGSIDRV